MNPYILATYALKESTTLHVSFRALPPNNSEVKSHRNSSEEQNQSILRENFTYPCLSPEVFLEIGRETEREVCTHSFAKSLEDLHLPNTLAKRM